MHQENQSLVRDSKKSNGRDKSNQLGQTRVQNLKDKRVKQYYVCSQRFQNTSNNDRELLEIWLLSH